MTASRKDLIKQEALKDLTKFIRLVHPNRALGTVHEDLIGWWTRPGSLSHQLVLLPRDHQKSALIAYRVAWEITKNPDIRILYISSTSNLAVKQLKFIKDILTSDTYRFYWPEMVNLDESKREKWTESEISVDHPIRKERSVRDPTIFTAGLTTTITGLHCDLAVLDDVVIEDTAYTKEGRDKVANQVSYLASICGVEARIWVVGTRYEPNDLYQTMIDTSYETYDETTGELIESKKLYEVFERKVENRGDGTGDFLWPRAKNREGRWFGFNKEILAKKKAQYYDVTKFRAQYYNEPFDLGTSTINRDKFQYYERRHLHQDDRDRWYYKDSRLNVFAAIDFAYSTSKTADFTCVVVVGVDARNNYYVLDLLRFKTNKIADYYDAILRLHMRWRFNKLRAEITAAQSVIVQDLKINYIQKYGLALSIDEHRPIKDKETWISSVLQPKYSNMQMWHYKSDTTTLLEEELIYQNPKHDDIKDALSSCVEIAVAPSFMNLGHHKSRLLKEDTSEYFNPRFGGVG